MDKKEYDALKAKFLKLVANVPLPLRDEIIAIVDNQTISWNAAYGEIKSNSDNAQLILTQLKKISLL